MGNIFKINCRKLYETGLYIDKEVEKLEENVTEMKKIKNNRRNRRSMEWH